MGVIFKTDERRVIPRLRSFNETLKTGELDLTTPHAKKLEFNKSEYLEEQIYSWKRHRRLFYANDLLSSAYVLGVQDEFKDVATFILDNEQNGNSPIIKIANETLANSTRFLEENPSSNYTELNKDKYRSEIRRHKAMLRREPKNAIAWLELGRLYSIIGQIEKAKKSIDTSLLLDKNNRFISRSASRFYHHFMKDEEQALQTIKNSDFLKYDPWLLSAEISYSTILNRFSRYSKIGKNYLENLDHNFQSITELASALATWELQNGKLDLVKKLFQKSIKSPNDNSLAQAEWLSDHVQGLSIEKSKFQIPLAFEAESMVAYEQKRYKDALEHALLWEQDEPYSTRPVLASSYIAGIFLNQKSEAIETLYRGLQVNNESSSLQNNLVYFLLLDGKIAEATTLYMDKLVKKVADNNQDSNKISIIGTGGLLLYRTGYIEEGKQLYLKAISLAEKTSSEYLAALAIGNFLREELLVSNNRLQARQYIEKLKKMKITQTEQDIKLLLNDAIALFDKAPKEGQLITTLNYGQMNLPSLII